MTKVILRRCEEYDLKEIQRILHESIEQLGGIPALRPGAKVLVKPNLLMRRDPDRHTTTHPVVVEAVVRQLQAMGCSVILADSPGGPFTEGLLRGLYALTGMEDVANRTGASLNCSTESVEVELPDAYQSHMLTVMRCAAEADCIVSVGKIKTHGLTAYTGAVKNLFGLVPGMLKVDAHARYPDISEFSKLLLDIERWAQPCLSVLDGIFGMEGAGPSGGSPRRLNALVVSDNAHACDVVGAALIGFAPEEVATLKCAANLGVLPVPVVVGDSVDSLAQRFRRAPVDAAARGILTNPIFARMVRSKPVVKKSKCVGCGACMRSCPGKAIELVDKRPRFYYENCIRCYCCQELCPQTAIEVWQPFFMKWLR